jgi:Glycosyltransferase
LIIIGDGILKDSLVKLSADDPRIFFTGPINHSEIVQFFQMSDVVLIPSITSNDIQEATSLSMLEGMSTGKVVICSNIGGMKEVIINNINGFLVKEKISR